MNQRLAYFYTGLTILAWSTVSTAFKISLRSLTPLGLLFYSSMTAVVVLGIALFFRPANKEEDSLKAVGKNLLRSLLPGLLNPFLYYLMLFAAYYRLRAQEAQVLNYTWAIVLSVMSVIFLREKFRFKDLLALLISFLGVVIISTKGSFGALGFDDPVGSLLAVSTSIVWAGYWILELKDKRDPVTKLYYNFFIGLLAISILIWFRQSEGQCVLFLRADQSRYIGIIAAIYVGIFEMGLTFLLWFKALSLTDNTAKISNLIFVTPFISLVFIGLILHEPIHPATLVGLILIVGSNLFQKLSPRIRTK